MGEPLPHHAKSHSGLIDLWFDGFGHRFLDKPVRYFDPVLEKPQAFVDRLELLQLGQRLHPSGKKKRLQRILAPCKTVFPVCPQTVAQRGIARSARPHLNRSPHEVMRRDTVAVQKAEHQLIIGRLPEIDVENTPAEIKLITQQK